MRYKIRLNRLYGCSTMASCDGRGATFYELGWKNEATEVLRKGVEKFPEDEELKKFLNDVEEDLDDPDGDTKPFLGLLILLALLHKRLKKKW